MKRSILFAAVGLFFSTHLQAQVSFNGIGEKGFYNKTIKGAEAFVLPQMSLNFETFVETGVVVQESGLSRATNNFSAMSKGGSYVGQTGSARATTILDAGLELSDFQQLANDFQKIMEEEIANAGFKVVSLPDARAMESFGKIAERYDAKAERKEGKTKEEDIGVGTIQVFPDGSIFIFNDKSVARGGGVAFVGMMKKFYGETDAVILLQNIDIDFSTVELKVGLEAGVKRKVTSADVQVFPKMRISKATFDFIGKIGSPNNVSANLEGDFVSEKPYKARIYQDKTKSDSFIKKFFAVNPPNIDFDPFIVEMTKEDYIAAARDLFRDYAKEFAKVLVVGVNK
ncbi:hypothetical protein E4S40_02195 [Algoriphagus kandeliae]|uniref:Uncharacterized protein n=1 Tax=Algoriphagus kandeliae TaxID=2562278 RepID=A0A4Y9R0C6_9BACT|nr:hypothetical protein [Algoriphagus kandeliae]TFV97488.1 hypothetical protein E4S40_02195 [Algoriphagus kandeliae]